MKRYLIKTDCLRANKSTVFYKGINSFNCTNNEQCVDTDLAYKHGFTDYWAAIRALELTRDIDEFESDIGIGHSTSKLITLTY